MYFIIAFQIYFILVVYSYFESLRVDPWRSLWLHCGICWRNRNSYGMLLFYASLSHVNFDHAYPVISFPLVHLLLFLLPWLTFFVFPEPYSPHHSLFSFQISLSILFINLSVWPLKWKKWVFTWAWNHFRWSHKNGFNVFFLSGRCKWEVLQLTQSFEPRKLSCGENN